MAGGGRARLPIIHKSVSWTLADGAMTLEVVVPPNATATVHLPGATTEDVTEGGMAVGEAVTNIAAAGIDDIGERGNRCVQQPPLLERLESGEGRIEPPPPSPSMWREAGAVSYPK